MADEKQIEFTVNDQALRAQLARIGDAAVNVTPLLKIAGQHMRGSIDRTFRDQGSPAGSWTPLAAATLRKTGKRVKGQGARGLQGALGRANFNASRKILIASGRLKNSITQSVQERTLTIGTNLRYARIHQLGGKAGRGRKVRIPARPYLVFRPEDAAAIVRKMDAYIAQNVIEGTA